MANYLATVVTAFSSNQNSPQLFANTGMANNISSVNSVGRYQGGLANSTINQIGQYFYLSPTNQKTTVPSQTRTSYPKLP